MVPDDSQRADPAPTAGAVSARRVTSVLFGDLVGFTTLAESRDPEDVRELLTEYFEECRAVIGRYGGVVEKFIGDAVMAVWGVPTTMEDDAERAVRAGLELVARVAALGDRLRIDQLGLRVGIVTGEVAVTVGADQQGMVAGDAVNTAARVQAVAAPGQVWVDETTRLLSSAAISYVDVGSHAMKGKADPMPLWAVRAVVASVGGGQRADGLEAPLVGRDRELRLVKEIFHGGEESGRPALMLIDGEAGVGKSRLGWEFEKYTDGLHTTVRWHSGRCLAYGEGVAYYALAEAVRGRLAAIGSDADPFDGSDDDGESDLPTLLAAGMATYVRVEDRDWVGPRLGALLGIETADTFSKEDLFSAWTAFFGAVGAAETSNAPAPVVLVIDDAHHADDGLLAYLEHLLAVADFPVFVLLLARPGLLDSRPSLAANRRVTVVHLEAVSAPAMGHLLDGLVAGLPERVRDDLVVRAEGVPLFAVETVRSLIDQDLVVPRGGQYVLADSDALDVTALAAPASLQALIAARLDTLPAQSRRIVDLASVLGLGFSRADIAELCPDVADLDGTLSALVRQQVLRLESDRLSPERGQFRFVQSGVRQVAHGMLSRRDRKTTHLAVCRSLEARQDPGGELAPVVAQHYLDAIDSVPDADDVAELSAAACRCLLRAADRAGTLGSPAEAAGHLAAARQHCSPDERLRIEVDLAEQLHRAGEYDQAIEVATRAMERGDAAGDVVRAAAAAATLAQSLMWSRAEYTPAERLVRERYAALPAADNDSLRVRLDLVRARGSALLRLGRDFKECAEEQMQLAEQTQDPRLIADSWSLFALALHDRGLPSLSGALMERAAQVGRDTRDLRLLTVTLVNHCAYVIREDVAKAARLADEALDVSRRLGDQSWFATSMVNALMAYLLRGDWSAYDRIMGIELDEQSMRPWRELTRVVVDAARGRSIASVADALPGDSELINDIGYSALRAAALAQEAAVSGDGSASTHAVQSVEKLFELARFSDDFTIAWVLASDVVWRARDEVALRRLIAIVDSEPGLLPTGLRCQRARLRALMGDRDGMPASEVETWFQEAVEEARRWGSAVWEAHACADLAAWLGEQGRHEDAAEPASRARGIYDDLGAAAWRARLDATLAKATV